MIARWTLSRIALVLLGPLSGLALAGCPASSGSTPDAASSASSDGAGVPSASAVAAEGSVTAATSAPVPAGSIVVSTEPVDAPGPVFTSDGPVDVLIQHGLVYDGSGGPPLRADVVIQGDEIAHVGPTSPELKAKLTVEAKGQAVTPGFIDTHAHGDPTSDNTNFVYQGVTSICLGQDGKSPSDDRIASWAKRNRKKKLRVNSLPFVGHGTARSRTKIGLAKDALSDAQLGKLQDFVAGELAAGAWGLTTGLEYRPGSLAETKELRAIAKPVASADGVIMSHLRSEDDDAIDAALDELLAQAEEGARVHVSHIKVVYGKGEARAEALLDKLEQARRKGYRVTADIYPYNASYTTISIVFPDWAKPPASYKRVKRERRGGLLEFLPGRGTRRAGGGGAEEGQALRGGPRLRHRPRRRLRGLLRDG